MKRILFLFLLAIPRVASAQPALQLYAYSQVVTPGTVPRNVTDENGKPVNSKKQAPVNYYFFAVFKSSARISFAELWINGNYYRIQTRTIDSTPVVAVNYNIPDHPVKELLVPATALRVISIIPVDPPGTYRPRASWFRNMVRHSVVIVSYFYNGRKYFTSVKKIKVLQAIAGV